MLLNYLKIALRTLRRHKLYSFINIFGLSIGVACCLLILLFIEHEWSFDRFHSNAGSLYRTVFVERAPGGDETRLAYQPLPLAPALELTFPEIEKAVRFFEGSGTISYGEKIFPESCIYTDSTVFSVFDFELLHGNPTTALARPGSVVLSRQIAQKYFGDENPVGLTVQVRNWKTREDHVVTGVVADIPDNSSLRFDVLFPMEHYPNYERNLNRWTNFNGSTWVLLRDGADANSLEEKLRGFVTTHWGEYRTRQQERGRFAEGDDAVRLYLQPLPEVHMDTSVGISPEPTSDPMNSVILAGIAFVVLLIACINFVALAVARSVDRAREVGVRKVLGGKRWQVARQFWGETILMSLLAFLIGYGLAEFLLPVFNSFAGKSLSFGRIEPHWSIAGGLALLIVVGAMAGSYPGLVLSRFRPTAVLKGTLKLTDRALFMRACILAQFGLSIFLSICAAVMLQQQDFIAGRDLGFNAERLIALKSYGERNDLGAARMRRLRLELASDPDILGVTGTSASFNKGWDINGFTHDGKELSAFVFRVDYEYLDRLGMKLVSGRNFSPGRPSDVRSAIIVNQAMVEQLNWDTPVEGRRLTGWNAEKLPEGPEIIGVVEDYHFLSLHQPIQPLIWLLDTEWPINDILIRVAGADMPSTLERIRQAWRTIAPDAPFNFTYVDDDLQRQYESELRWQRIMMVSTFLAVLLGCLGLFGLATLSAARRARELGIRKVFGAPTARLVVLLCKEFALLVGLANLLAWPFAWLAMQQWLEQFAYRTAMTWWVFAAAGAAALLIALITVGIQAARAALSNPVDLLRYE